MLSRTLGGILQVTAGDGVEVESLEGGRLRRRVVVSGLVDDLVGLSAYMRPEAIVHPAEGLKAGARVVPRSTSAPAAKGSVAER